MVLTFFPEDRERARWLEAVPSSARSHDLLSSPHKTCPWTFALVPYWLRKAGLDP